jgi:predicted secreted protein
VNRGTTTISMKYSRSWEKNKPPEKTTIFTVFVR